MNALVIYDSWYGNTRYIAEAIGQGLASNALIIDAHNALRLPLHHFDLLIVGSPTHASMPTPAIQTFLNKIGDDELKGVYIAAFDTRLPSRWLRIIGFASRRIIISLRGRGGCTIVPPTGFYVGSREGPIKRGEVERAQKWGRELASIWRLSRAPEMLPRTEEAGTAPEINPVKEIELEA